MADALSSWRFELPGSGVRGGRENGRRRRRADDGGWVFLEWSMPSFDSEDCALAETNRERERERGLEREIVLTGSGYGDDGDPPVFGFPASSWNAISNTDLLLFSPPSVCPSVRREGVRFLLQSSENLCTLIEKNRESNSWKLGYVYWK